MPIPLPNLAKQLAFALFAVAKQATHTDIVREQRQEQGIFAIALKLLKTFPKVGTQERIGLSLCHLSRELLPLFKLVTIADIGIMLLAVPPLRVFDSKHSSFKRRQVTPTHSPLCHRGSKNTADRVQISI